MLDVVSAVSVEREVRIARPGRAGLEVAVSVAAARGRHPGCHEEADSDEKAESTDACQAAYTCGEHGAPFGEVIPGLRPGSVLHHLLRVKNGTPG